MPDNKSFETKQILYAFFFPAIFVFILWIVWILGKGFDMDGHWYRFGIIPRTWDGLRGILFCPFIHSDASHLYSNSVPLLVLCWCLVYFYKDLGYWVFPFLWVLSGIFTWLIGRDSSHIGASGLIYALSSFLFFSGILRKHIPLTAVSLIVVFLYGSTVWSMFPVTEVIDPAISWEAHLSGAVGGIICAVMFRNEGPKAPEMEEEEEEELNGTQNN